MHRARRWVFLPIFLSSVLLTGCAGVALTLLGVGAGVAAGTAVSYTLDGTAYRTFTVDGLSFYALEGSPRIRWDALR